MEPTHVRLTIPDSIDPTELMGPADVLLRRVEGAFEATISVRGNHIALAGDPDEVEDWRLAEPEELRMDMNAHPEEFSEWFRIIINRYFGFIAK